MGILIKILMGLIIYCVIGLIVVIRFIEEYECDKKRMTISALLWWVVLIMAGIQVIDK